MFDTQVTVVGNLVADPRLNYTNDGIAVASFRLASTPRRFDRASSEWRDGDTLYASVTCWRGLAENVSASLRKGNAVVVIGRLSVRPYETKDGEKRQSVDIDALAVGPDLARAIAVVKRAERGQAPASVPGSPPAAFDASPVDDDMAIAVDDEMAIDVDFAVTDLSAGLADAGAEPAGLDWGSSVGLADDLQPESSTPDSVAAQLVGAGLRGRLRKG